MLEFVERSQDALLSDHTKVLLNLLISAINLDEEYSGTKISRLDGTQASAAHLISDPDLWVRLRLAIKSRLQSYT